MESMLVSGTACRVATDYSNKRIFMERNNNNE
jgi:hypothetical protein